MKKLIILLAGLFSLNLIAAAQADMIEVVDPAKETNVVIDRKVVEDAVIAARDLNQGSHLEIIVQGGTFNGFRLQVVAAGDDNFQLILEGFAGNGQVKAGWAQIYGGGVRFGFTVASDGKNNALTISPGVNVYFTPATQSSWGPFTFQTSSTVVYIAPSVDVTYSHMVAENFGFILGARAGAAWVVKDSQDLQLGDMSWELGVFTGIKF